MMRRRRIEGPGDVKDVRIVDGPGKGEDIGRVTEHGILYPDELAQKLCGGYNGRDRLLKELDEANEELDQQKAKLGQLKPIKLGTISRHSDIMFTHIRFEDFDLSRLFIEERDGVKHGLNWLEFGEARINNAERVHQLGGRIADDITDWEHDTCFVVHIDLIGLTYKFTDNHISWFEAHLSTDPKEIQIYPADFDPRKVEGGGECEDCDNKHWMLPDGYYRPPMYEFAHQVAGKRVTITMGPRWSALDPDE